MFSMSMMMSAASQAMDYTKFLLRPSSCISDETGADVSLDKAIYFNGSSYLTLADNADWAFGTGNFTIEFWIRTYSNSCYPLYQGNYGGSHTTISPLNIYITTGKLVWCPDYYNYPGHPIQSVTIIADGAWHHVAVVRNGAYFKMYIDGINEGGVVDLGSGFSSLDSSELVYIGASVSSGVPGSYLTGYISNFRISKGTTRYTSNFTPSTTITLDSYDKLVIAPLNSTISDATTAKVITKTGNPTVNLAKNAHPVRTYGDVAIQPLKVTSWPIYFDGSGDYLSLAASSDFDFGSGDFTLETYMNMTSYNAYPHLITRWPGIANNYDFMMRLEQQSGSAFKIVFGYTLTGDASGANALFISSSNVTISLNTWYHVALSRHSNILYIYLDGILVGSAALTTSIPYHANALNIARSENNPSQYLFNGYLANIRVSKGISRWNQNFNPDTIDYTVDSYTKLLIESNSTVISDRSGKAITVNGDTKVIVAPTLDRVLSFDGTGDYLDVAADAETNLGTGDFTIDYWINPVAGRGDYDGTVLAYYNSGMTDISLYIGNGYNPTDYAFGFGYAGNRVYNQGGIPRNVGVWNHHACVRSGSTITIYVNGIATVTLSNAGAVNIYGAYLRVGQRYGESLYLNAKIANLRISKGIARWTSNFAPPVSVASDANTILLIKDDFVDLSSADRTVTKYGDVKAVYNLPLADKALKFDGSGDYLTVNDSDDWNLGSGDFTIETWVNLTNVSGWKRIATQTGTSNNDRSFYLTVGDSTLHFAYSITSASSFDVDFVCSKTLTANTWYHIAIVRSNTSLTFYVNGVLSNTTSITNAIRNSGAVLEIGGISENYAGYMCDFRITKGKALYTTNFVPASM